MTSHIKSIPFKYKDGSSESQFNRLMVLPLPKESAITDYGLILPKQLYDKCETGRIVSVCPGSEFQEGSVVMYAKVDRSISGGYDSVIIDMIEYDCLFENEVWAVDGMPYKRVFIKPLSLINLSENGVIIPESVKGVPQRGLVHSAPAGSFLTKGDTVEYRKQEGNIYDNITMEDISLDVLWETDIFTYNGIVSPHRIIVKIDMVQQGLKRRTTETGIKLSPIFVGMLRNLQYGEIIDIGVEAQKEYPELKMGDTAILHHTIEHQPYRLLSQTISKKGNILFEYRMIHAFNPKAREIFGRLKRTGRSDGLQVITPYNKGVFLSWKIDTFEKRKADPEIPGSFSLNDLDNLPDFKHALEKEKKRGADHYKMKFQQKVDHLNQYNPAIESNQEIINLLKDEIYQLKRDVERATDYLKKNHILRCKVVFPDLKERDILTTYAELYPINILGKKYLIAHEDFILAQIDHTNKKEAMAEKFQPYGDRVLVLPIIEEMIGSVILPPGGREKPVKGTILKVGQKTEWAKEGEIALFRKGMGIEIELDGVKHLILKENDLLGALPNSDEA